MRAVTSQTAAHGGRHVAVALLTVCLALALSAQRLTDRVVGPVDAAQRVNLKGHLPLWVSDSRVLGPVPDTVELGHVTIMLTGSAEQEETLQQLLRALQAPESPEFHRWLNPSEIGERFGVSPNDLAALVHWLASEGLQVDPIPKTRRFLTFTGTARQLGAAFAVKMRYYEGGSGRRVAPDRAPSIPARLAPIVSAVIGLSSEDDRPALAPLEPLAYRCIPVCENDLAPPDFAAIYDLPPTSPQSGAGQTIAIAGRARVAPQDVINFSSAFQLGMATPAVIVPPNGLDPGPPVDTQQPGATLDDQREATLDVTRAGSIAPGASLDLIISADGPNGTTPGIVTDVEYVINNDDKVKADILSISFIACEEALAPGTVQAYDQMFALAAAEGISVFVSSGDSGAACGDIHGQSPPAIPGPRSINAYCSSGNVTCVGGTEFAADTPAHQDAYWKQDGVTDEGTALQYIPEGAWNDSPAGTVDASGGGSSSVIPAPDWQNGPGILRPLGRLVPDVSLSASGLHDPYLYCMAAYGADCAHGFNMDGGTSASAPSMAGIMALVGAAAGGRQGNANPTLYRMARGAEGSLIFHDVTATSSGVSGCDAKTPSLCNNSVPLPSGPPSVVGTTGFVVAPGFDEATGWGSVDVKNLIANWTSSALYAPVVTLEASTDDAFPSQALSFTVSATGLQGVPTGSVELLAGGTSISGEVSLTNGVATISGVTLPAVGTYLITAQYSGDAVYQALQSEPQSIAIVDYSLTPASQSVSVSSSSQTGTGSLTVTPLGNFSAAVSFSCAGLPAYSSCRFVPATVTPGGTPVGVQVEVLTALKSGAGLPGWRSGRIPATLLTATAMMLLLLALVWQRDRRSLLMAALVIGVLVAGSVAEGSCGGCQCTPPGTVAVTVTAATSGTPADSHTATIQLSIP